MNLPSAVAFVIMDILLLLLMLVGLFRVRSARIGGVWQMLTKQVSHFKAAVLYADIWTHCDFDWAGYYLDGPSDTCRSTNIGFFDA